VIVSVTIALLDMLHEVNSSQASRERMTTDAE
jgi:hypothetical protein